MGRRNRFAADRATPLIFLLLAACAGAGPRPPIDPGRAQPLGDPAAPIVVVVFSDFQCSHCKRAAEAMHRLAQEHPEGIVFYFKHFPLPYYRWSGRAALAAEAARLQGAFWEMHDLLFAHAGELSADIWAELARRAGLDVERFERDMAAPTTEADVLEDLAEGEALGVDGTPTFFVDGVRTDVSRPVLMNHLARRAKGGD